MTRRPIQNFRGVHASIVAPDDGNRVVLAATLERLGLVVSCLTAGPPAEGAADILFVDADALDPARDVTPWGSTTALVTIIGHETPSRLQRAYELEPAAFLMKPIRPNGVFTAVYFAANQHRRRRETLERLEGLEARLGARRFVVKAILHLIEAHGIDDDEAYRRLRRESMRQRVTVEELAVQLVARQESRPRRRQGG
jgi:AmiR/NasT family two-component response regulator